MGDGVKDGFKRFWGTAAGYREMDGSEGLHSRLQSPLQHLSGDGIELSRRSDILDHGS